MEILGVYQTSTRSCYYQLNSILHKQVISEMRAAMFYKLSAPMALKLGYHSLCKKLNKMHIHCSEGVNDVIKIIMMSSTYDPSLFEIDSNPGEIFQKLATLPKDDSFVKACLTEVLGFKHASMTQWLQIDLALPEGGKNTRPKEIVDEKIAKMADCIAVLKKTLDAVKNLSEYDDIVEALNFNIMGKSELDSLDEGAEVGAMSSAPLMDAGIYTPTAKMKKPKIKNMMKYGIRRME